MEGVLQKAPHSTINTPSIKEVDARDSEKKSQRYLASLLSGKVTGVDEICLEDLKSLDVVELSWLTGLCSMAQWSGTVPLEWQTGVVVLVFKKGP